MSKFLLVALLLIVLAAGGFWYWTTTPQYSMVKLAESVRNHDLATFRIYFDVDRVSRNAVDDLTASGVEQVGGTGLLQRLVGKTLGGFFKPQLTQMLSDKITNYVATDPSKNSDKGTSQQSSDPAAQTVHSDTEEAPTDSDSVAVSVNANDDGNTSVEVRGPAVGRLGRAVKGFFHKLKQAIKVPSLREVLHDMGLRKENYRGLTPFETSGQISHVSLKFQEAGKNETQVQLELENADNHWRVVKFSNLDTLARSVSGI